MLTEREKMLSGLAHLPSDPELSALRTKVKDLIFQYNTQVLPSDKVKRAVLLQQIFPTIGTNPHINMPFYCDYGINVEIGDNFYANYGCTMLDNGGIKIGDNVMFAPHVSLYTVGHPLHFELRNQGWEQAGPIQIGNNVWIGANSIILPNVTIGDNVVIGAGSLVTKSIPANSLAMGSPCRVIRQITEQDKQDYYHTFMPSDV